MPEGAPAANDPIVVGDQLVGGIGVSGGHYSEDMKVAEAALAALD